MEILDGIILEDLFLYLPEHKIVVLSDIHIGYEESLNRQGILIPRNNYNDLLIRIERALEKIKKKYSIERIILNGDIIHDFGKVSRKEKETTKRFMSFLSRYGSITVVEGNHDMALKYFISDDHDVELVDKVVVGKILILHGDKVLLKSGLKNIDVIIIGHEHPAVSIKSGSRVEKYKCFLKGKYRGKSLIVMPSCNLFIEGTDILRDKVLSPFLKGADLEDFEVYLIGDARDELYDFGKLKDMVF